jgi:hypothetical protein
MLTFQDIHQTKRGVDDAMTDKDKKATTQIDGLFHCKTFTIESLFENFVL